MRTSACAPIGVRRRPISWTPTRSSQVVRAATHDPVCLQDLVFGAGPNDATVVDERQVVADAVQVGGDVRGEQDAVSLVEEEVSDDADELVTGGRVQAAGRLVEDEQPCLVRQRHGDHEFHRHATGQVFDLGPQIEAELVEQLAVAPTVPAVVEGTKRPLDLGQPPVAHEKGVVEHHADVLAQGDRSGYPVAEQFDLTGVDRAHAQQAADRRCLAGAVGADQAHDVARRQFEAHIAQREVVAHRGTHATQGEREVAGH